MLQERLKDGSSAEQEKDLASDERAMKLWI